MTFFSVAYFALKRDTFEYIIICPAHLTFNSYLNLNGFLEVLLKYFYANDLFSAGGKRDETLILPANDNLSLTLDTHQVKA